MVVSVSPSTGGQHAPASPTPNSGSPPSAGRAGGSPVRHLTPHPLVFHPNNPMANARLLVERWFTSGRGETLFVYHHGVCREWSGASWPEQELDAVREAIWTYFEHAEYEKRKPDGSIVLVPFRPNKGKVANILEALQAVTYLDQSVEMPSWLVARAVKPTDFLPTSNGLLHVATRELVSATPTFYNAYSLPFPFDPEARPPERWLRFLDELWPDDEASKLTLQEIFGCCLMPDTTLQKVFLIVGPRRSGKGTIARVLTGLIGKHNVAAPTLASLGTNFGVRPLLDRPVAIISDARLGGRTDGTIVTERLLSISGEDSLTVDRKYRSPLTARLPTRLLLMSNELPRLSDTSGALASRFIVLATRISFLGREDPGLTARLLQELPGILLWSLDGLDRLRERGYFLQPGSGSELVHQLENLSSPVATFLAEVCEVGPHLSVPIPTAYGVFVEWCEANGLRPPSSPVFGRDLRAALPDVQIGQHRLGEGGRRERRYHGLGLKPTSGRDGFRSQM